ncbi:MAG TPA: AraC family transcriptional regulator [Rhizobium sp.]|nr:AraC family transcriptional regulator [Rhizobium sp.]
MEHQKMARKVPAISSLVVGEIVISRVWSDGHDIAPLPRSRREEAFFVSVQLRKQDNFQLWRGRERVSCGSRDEATLAILDLTESWQIHYGSAFEALHFHIPFDALRRFANDAGHPLFMGIDNHHSHHDPVMFALAQALLPALENPQEANVLFVERIGLAVLAHLSQTYGGVYFPVDKKGTLAPWQERRVSEYLTEHFQEPVAVADLAQICALSQSYFIKAFKESFGRTPYRWLSEYRVARARDLLKSDISIAEIAIECGFSDQSHMTRSFRELVGVAPGQFRRQNRNDGN